MYYFGAACLFSHVLCDKYRVLVWFDCITAVKATVLDGETIVGITVMKSSLYVLRQNSSEIEIYDTETFKLQQREVVTRRVAQVTSSLSTVLSFNV